MSTLVELYDASLRTMHFNPSALSKQLSAAKPGGRDSVLIPSFSVRASVFTIASPLLEECRAIRADVEVANIKVTVNMEYYRLVVQCIQTATLRVCDTPPRPPSPPLSFLLSPPSCFLTARD